MDLHDVNPHSAHHIWPKGGCSSRSRMAVSFLAKLLSCSYIIQANRARFNQNSVNPTCPLCKQAPEDLPHFLLSCPGLEPTRTKSLPKIKRLASTLGIYLSDDSETLSKQLLNSTNPDSCCACSEARFINSYNQKKREGRRRATLCVSLTLYLSLHVCSFQSITLS